MSESETIDLINQSLAKEFELNMEDMVPEAALYSDLGLDSLDSVDMVIVLEQAFKFRIRDEEAIRQIRTLEDIHKFVVWKKKEAEGGQG